MFWDPDASEGYIAAHPVLQWIAISFVYRTIMVISTALTGARIVARWVSGGDVRGTWDILSSCLGTIVICTCSAFHDDVPHTRPENRRRVFALLELGRYMPIFLLLPEVLPSVAFEQLRCAYIIFVNVKHVKVGTMWHSINDYHVSYIHFNRNQIGRSPILSMQLPEAMPSTSSSRITENFDTILLPKDFSS